MIYVVYVSEKVNYFKNDQKYFIGFSEDHRNDINPLYITLLQMTTYIEKIKWMYFFSSK